MKKILFTPIGMTDPITNLRDGSMLHICRVYKPDIVILYMSEEVVKNHEKDNRYLYCLEQLSKRLNHPMEYHCIMRPDLKNVHIYDYFYNDFQEIIKKILQGTEQGDEIFVNVASGTPVMKSALLDLSVLFEYKFLPIQVETPAGKSNPAEDKTNYDVETNWELNEDNEETFVNRCTKPQTRQFAILLLKNNIRKLVLTYNYQAALEVANGIKENMSENAMNLLQIGSERLKLNTRAVDKLAKNTPYDLISIKSADQRTLFEYALILEIKCIKEEYADFMRALTPLTVDLVEIILEKQCGVQIDDYCYYDRNHVRKFDVQKLEGTQVKAVLDEEFNGKFKPELVGTRQMVPLIRHYSSDTEMKEKLDSILAVEQNLRNLSAHEIVSVTPEWIKQKSGYTVKQIFDMIKYLIVKVGINATKEAWKSYDKMNEYIIKELEQS